MSTRRKLALLMIKINDHNLYQIEPPDPSAVSIGIVRPSMPPDAALLPITATEYDANIWAILLLSLKYRYVWRILSEESLVW